MSHPHASGHPCLVQQRAGEGAGEPQRPQYPVFQLFGGLHNETLVLVLIWGHIHQWSGITAGEAGGALGTLWGAEDRTPVSCVQEKSLGAYF